jgi:hypothetical protein
VTFNLPLPTRAPDADHDPPAWVAARRPLSNEDLLAQLDREVTASLRDHPDRIRWTRAAGLKTSRDPAVPPPPRPPRPRTSLDDRVVGALAAGPSTLAQLAATLDASGHVVRLALGRLAAAGRARHACSEARGNAYVWRLVAPPPETSPEDT